MPAQRVVRADAPSHSTLAAQLATQRSRCFVGRQTELAMFESFAAPGSPLALWFIHGAGGIGKSALLQRLLDDANRRALPHLYLDARRVAPNPPAVEQAVAGLAGNRSLAAYCAGWQRPLLLVDTFEYWLELSDWLCRDFLPRLPANLALIVAGRHEPGPDWYANPYWRERLCTTPLPALSGDECMHYLQARAVPAQRAKLLTEFSRGNALALAMAADTVTRGHIDDLTAAGGWSVYEALLARFTREAREPGEQLALDACAVAYQLTEDLLARVFECDDVSWRFRWLADLSFIDHGPNGLYPHDIVREALMQTMSRRAPGRYEWLARTVVNWVVDRMEGASDLTPAAAAQVGADGMYALRDVAVVQYYLNAERSRSLYVDRVRSDADWRALADMTWRHEGDESCAWFEFWRRRYPDNVMVIRGIEGDARAYVLRLDMERLAVDDRDADPLTRRLWQFIQSRIQPVSGEHLVFNRFWVNYDYAAYGSPEKTQMMMAITNYNMTTPNLRLTAQVFGTRTPSWPQQARAIGLHLVDEQAIAVGEHTYHIFYNDWLRESPMRYYRLFADRCIAFEHAMQGMTPHVPTPVSLDRVAFRDAVLDALRHWQRSAALADNALLASASVIEVVGAHTDVHARVATLIELMSAAIDAVRQQGRRRYGKILHGAYVEPARTQQAAAVALDMSYSSYRRNLAEARNALVAELWRRELAARGD